MNLAHQRLPQVYQRPGEQSEIATALTQGAAEKLEEILGLLTNEEYRKNFLDPATAKSEWLDAIARWGGWGDYWNSSFSTQVKRNLLLKTKEIFDNRGNRIGFSVFMDAVGYAVELKAEDGFIAGTSILPDNLGGNPFAYCVEVPQSFHEGSPERAVVKRAIANFLPCWGQYIIKQRS